MKINKFWSLMSLASSVLFACTGFFLYVGLCLIFYSLHLYEWVDELMNDREDYNE